MLDKFGRRFTEDESGDIRDVRTSCRGYDYGLEVDIMLIFPVVSYCPSQSQQAALTTTRSTCRF